MNRFLQNTKDVDLCGSTDSSGKVRSGIVGKIDLEQYDYRKKSTSFIRATEATVAERILRRVVSPAYSHSFLFFCVFFQQTHLFFRSFCRKLAIFSFCIRGFIQFYEKSVAHCCHVYSV